MSARGEAEGRDANAAAIVVLGPNALDLEAAAAFGVDRE